MANISPMQILAMAKQKGPQAAAMQIIQNNFQNNPLMLNLLDLGKKGDINNLEKIAQQILGQQGKDLNNEIASFLTLIQ